MYIYNVCLHIYHTKIYVHSIKIKKERKEKIKLEIGEKFKKNGEAVSLDN